MDNALTISEINKFPEQTYNMLFPATLTEISPLHKIIVNIVKINTDPLAKEIYKQKNGEYSLTKIGCLRLMGASNVIMENSEAVPAPSCIGCLEIVKATRIPPKCAECPNWGNIAYKVSILVPEPSGGYRRFVATKEVTKQDTLADKNPVKHMGANCETKALLRAGREGLGLKGSYTMTELSKPFAVALVVPNTQDPDLKKALIARYAAGQDALFGGQSTVVSVSLPAGNHPQLLEGTVNGEIVIPDEPDSAPDVNDDIPPWEQVNNSVPCCEVCHKPIESAGAEWPVQRVVEYLMAKRGRLICSGCQAGGGQ